MTDCEIKDETGRTLIQLLKSEFDTDPVADPEIGIIPCILRNRPPFNRIASFDKVGDASQLIIDNITLTRHLPLRVAYIVATNFIRQYADKYELVYVKFEEGKPDEFLREGALWSKNIIDEIPVFCRAIIGQDVEIRAPPASWYRLAVSCDTDRGRRKTQEDRMLCLPSLEMHCLSSDGDDTGNSEPSPAASVSLLAVFDGHGGSSIAAYCTGQLPFEMTRALRLHPENTQEALAHTMDILDKRVVSRCKVEPWNNIGSTAVVAAIDDKDIHIRWLGDSPAYILSTTEVTKVTKAHQPKDEKEAARVQAAGGELLYIQGELRVNGVLNITRALGDLSGRPMVSGESDGVSIARDPSQYLVMLMCDGISDLYSEVELFQMVEAFVRENEVEDYHELAEFIVRTAVESGGSSDNCTCVVGFLRSPDDLWQLLGEEGESSSDSGEEEEE